MQVTMDGTVKYAGHEVIKTRDGKEFVNLSVVDENNVPFALNFCPGEFQRQLAGLEFGHEISFVFEVRRFSNSLNLRAKEVLV